MPFGTEHGMQKIKYRESKMFYETSKTSLIRFFFPKTIVFVFRFSNNYCIYYIVYVEIVYKIRLMKISRINKELADNTVQCKMFYLTFLKERCKSLFMLQRESCRSEKPSTLTFMRSLPLLNIKESHNYLWSKKKYCEKKICILITFPIPCEGSGGNL